jgi:hypothetical protein
MHRELEDLYTMYIIIGASAQGEQEPLRWCFECCIFDPTTPDKGSVRCTDSGVYWYRYRTGQSYV